MSRKIKASEGKFYKVKCAWCHRVLKWSSLEHSHGICQACAKMVWKEFEDGIISKKDA